MAKLVPKDDLSDWGDPTEDPSGKAANGWNLTRERILMFSGLTIIAFELIHAELFNGTFHLEFLVVGCALCGISITQWNDRK